MTPWLEALFLVGPVALVPLWWRRLPVPADAAAARLLELGRRTALPAGVLLAIAFLLTTGPLAGALALPWVGFTLIGATAALLDTLGRTWPRRSAPHSVDRSGCRSRRPW